MVEKFDFEISLIGLPQLPKRQLANHLHYQPGRGCVSRVQKIYKDQNLTLSQLSINLEEVLDAGLIVLSRFMQNCH